MKTREEWERFPVGSISEGQCPVCREIVKVPPGFYKSWDDVGFGGKFPEHACKGSYQPGSSE